MLSLFFGDQMCVCVTSVAPNGKGSAYAYLRDESGEIGGAICTEVFDHFPTVAEGSTLLLKRVRISFSLFSHTCFFRFLFSPHHLAM